jgi:hypothetical protein
MTEYIAVWWHTSFETSGSQVQILPL